MPHVTKLPAAETISLPIPVYEQIEIGRMEGKDGEQFSLCVGLNREMVRKLQEKSLDVTDTDIQNNTSDRERFGEGSYEEWFSKDRVPFALVHITTGQLAALAWFGPKPVGRKSLKHLSAEERLQDERDMDAELWHTIVYRSYRPFRGVGLMKVFTQFTIDMYKTWFPEAKLWAGIHSENPASLGLMQALGFVIDAELSHPNEHHYVLTKE